MPEGTAIATPPAAHDFARLTDPYRRELLVHCYRMVGSMHDAEDLVQDVYLRAWRGFGGFEGRASLRTWLYRIATRTCLTALESRGRRPLPSGLGAPSDSPEVPVVASGPEVSWLEPLPDDPAEIVAARQSTRLALIAALQHLPPRQRAVLILRDVLRWRAAEVAALLDTTTAAVNSALQRARAQLDAAAPAEDQLVEPADPRLRSLLDRYAAAFETSDIPALMLLLAEEAGWEMPPFPQWFVGRGDIARLISTQCPAGPGDLRMIPLTANGQPAFAVYLRSDDHVFRAFQLQVLTATPAEVTHVTTFFDVTLFPKFGLPTELAGARGPLGTRAAPAPAASRAAPAPPTARKAGGR
ncbi:RNA polymerase ECF family sigma subunit [Murinocardiopsis flavida]|uniref:RNA polymerase sigma factor n=1 Tax=Murinocardiopsis flavida TaxID=645275 RepID=A0A2P8DDW7_9ACTN|nr:sigma-70 family RNA polymerase sigma factor [Murinocardiopsis flavida]PSK95420.1 RNA polymerase ECF family sigma subunit [Murinocardiopsis flavida]